VTFKLAHDFVEGATFLGLRLASCKDCGALRVIDDRAAGRVTWIRRASIEEERIRELAPPCVPPPVHFRAPW